MLVLNVEQIVKSYRYLITVCRLDYTILQRIGSACVINVIIRTTSNREFSLLVNAFKAFMKNKNLFV